MKNPVYEQIQARKVKARLRMLQHAKRLSGNVSQTCRFFGVSRALYYIWKRRYEKNGLAGLRDQPRRPHNIRYRIPPEIVSLILRIREERRYGAVRVSLYLQRHYHAYVSPTTILKIFHRHHVGPVSQKKYRPGPKPPDAPLQVPGRSVQLDVKFVPRVGRARQRFYQFTAIDEATRFRVLRIYDHDNTKTAIDFLRERRFPLPFRSKCAASVATVKSLCFAISSPRSHVSERFSVVGSLRTCWLKLCRFISATRKAPCNAARTKAPICCYGNTYLEAPICLAILKSNSTRSRCS